MIIDAATLATAVRTVLPATRANHLPVLKGVRLEGTTVTATDLDLTISTAITEAGTLPACVVPAALLSVWLEGVEGDVVLEIDDADLVMTSVTGTMRLRTLPIEDWPTTEEADGEAVPLDRRIATILYAASSLRRARPILNGVGIGDGWACCTDSYQLSAVRVDGPQAIVPVRVLELALKNEGDVTMAVDERRVTVTVGATRYTGRLIEGIFPNWQRLVGEPKTTVTLDRERTIAALERVMVLAEGIETPVRVTPDSNGLRFTIVSRDVGEIVEHIDGGSELGAEFGFRPRLLLNLLRFRDEAKVELGVTDHNKPVMVRDDNSVALVMPVRL